MDDRSFHVERTRLSVSAERALQTSTPSGTASKRGQIGNLTIPLVLFFFVLVGIVLMAAVGPIFGWTLLAVGLFVSMSIGRPRLILYLYLLWSAVMELAMVVARNPIIRFADEIIVMVVVGVVAMEHITHRKTYPELRTFLRMSYLLILVSLISAVLNFVPVKGAFHFFLSYLSFIPVFYLAYQAFQPRDCRLLLKVLVGAFSIQLVLNAAWWLEVIPMANASLSSSDFAVGTLGVCNIVAYFSAVVVVAAFAALRIHPGPMHRVACGLIMVGGLLQLYITFTVHAYLLLLAAFLVYYFLVFKDLRHRWAPPAVAALTLSILLLLDTAGGSSQVLGQGQFGLLNRENFARRWTMLIEGPKGDTLRRFLVFAPESSLLVPFIGGGPGNFLSSIGIINIAPQAREVVGDFYLTHSGRVEMIGGSIVQHPVTGYLAILSELGLIGFVLYIGLYGYAVARIARQYARSLYTRPDQYLVAQVTIVTGVVFLGINLLSEFFYFDFIQAAFWLMAACVWMPYQPETPDEAVEPADAARRPSLLSHLYRPTPSLGPRVPEQAGVDEVKPDEEPGRPA